MPWLDPVWILRLGGSDVCGSGGCELCGGAPLGLRQEFGSDGDDRAADFLGALRLHRRLNYGTCRTLFGLAASSFGGRNGEGRERLLCGLLGKPGRGAVDLL